MSQAGPVPLPAQRSAAPASRESLATGQVEPNSAEPVAVPLQGHFEGLLTFRGAAAVLGTFSGEVNARGRLRIGPGALVEANVHVDELIIEGFLRGDVRARTRVELAPSARVEGHLEAPRVELREGCRFRGRCQSGDAAGSGEPR